MSRRHRLVGGDAPDVPFADNLVFWAPLTEGDLTDHISGTTASVGSTATVQFDSAQAMYYLYTGYGNSTSYLQTLSWSNLPNLTSFPNGVTLYVECAEIQGECSGNSYSGIVSLPIISSDAYFTYLCNYRYTNRTNYSPLLSLAKYTGTFDGRTAVWYKDGVETQRNTSWTQGIYNGSISVCQLHKNNYKYAIYAKDVRVYDRALTAAEVAQL